MGTAGDGANADHGKRRRHRSILGRNDGSVATRYGLGEKKMGRCVDIFGDGTNSLNTLDEVRR